jgi:hypothetical protein
MPLFTAPITHLEALEDGDWYRKGDVFPVVRIGTDVFSVVIGGQTLVGMTSWIGSKFRSLSTITLVLPTTSVDFLFRWLTDAVEAFNSHTIGIPIKWKANGTHLRLTGSYYVDEE